MSNGLLTVTFQDGYKLYSQYQGSSDNAYPNLFDTPEEAWSFNRHRVEDFEKLHDGREIVTPEPVTVHAAYGGGFSWQGYADRTTKRLQTLSSYEEVYDNAAT